MSEYLFWSNLQLVLISLEELFLKTKKTWKFANINIRNNAGFLNCSRMEILEFQIPGTTHMIFFNFPSFLN